jgi:anti-sigma factor RsiW
MNKGCTITNREDTVIAYLYDDLAQGERLAFETHLTECFVCQSELNELGAVRGQLQQWSPPEPARALSGAVASPPPVAAPSRRWSTLKDIPVWAQAAAAVLVVGVAAGAANLQVKVATDGLTVNTGWLKPAAPVPTSTDAVSQDELRALAIALRQEMDAKVNATSALVESTAARRGDEALNKTRAMLAASEQKVLREFGIGVANLRGDTKAQRDADMQRIAAALQLQDTRSMDIAYKTTTNTLQRVSLSK